MGAFSREESWGGGRTGAKVQGNDRRRDREKPSHIFRGQEKKLREAEKRE